MEAQRHLTAAAVHRSAADSLEARGQHISADQHRRQAARDEAAARAEIQGHDPLESITDRGWRHQEYPG